MTLQEFGRVRDASTSKPLEALANQSRNGGTTDVLTERLRSGFLPPFGAAFADDLAWSQSTAFIEALTGFYNKPVTFQTYDPDRKSPHLRRVFHGSLNEHFGILRVLNEQGAAVCIRVNETDLSGARSANVIALRALFIDADDDAAIEPKLPFSFSVIGRDGRPHGYWKLRPGEDLSRFEMAQEQLAGFYDTDASVKKLSGCMRLPGFRHNKDGSSLIPQLQVDAIYEVAIDSEDIWEVPLAPPEYTVDEVLAAHGLSTSPEAPAHRAAFAEPPAEDVTITGLDLETRLMRARAYADASPPAIQGKHGDDWTYGMAVRLTRGFDITEEDALPILRDFNKRCVPPWTEEELRAKLQHAAAYAKDSAGYLLGGTVCTGRDATSDFDLITANDFLSEPDEPVPSYLGDGLIVKGGGYCVLSGPMNIKKSWFAIHLAVCLSEGIDFLGFKVHRPVKVLLMETESSRTALRRRVAKVVSGLGLTSSPRNLYFLLRSDRFPQIGGEIEEVVRRELIEVAILDTNRAFWMGDENSNTDWGEKVTKHFRRISRSLPTQPTFFLTHHHAKIEATNSKSRGASSIEADASTVLYLTKGNAGQTLLTFTKVKDGPPHEQLLLEFNEDRFIHEVVAQGPVTARRWSNADRRRFEFLRDYLEQHGPTKNEDLVPLLVDRFRVREETVRKDASKAAKAGYLRVTEQKGVYRALTPEERGPEIDLF